MIAGLSCRHEKPDGPLSHRSLRDALCSCRLSFDGDGDCAPFIDRPSLAPIFAWNAGLHHGNGGVLRRSSYGTVADNTEDGIRLRSPEYLRPYLEAQKNDDRDAEAAADPPCALSNSGARSSSTSRCCIGCGIGWSVSACRRPARSGACCGNGDMFWHRAHLLADLLAPGRGSLSPRMAFLLGDMCTRWPTSMPGICALNATAGAAAVGNAATLTKGQDVPCQHWQRQSLPQLPGRVRDLRAPNPTSPSPRRWPALSRRFCGTGKIMKPCRRRPVEKHAPVLNAARRNTLRAAKG